jgi:cytochrome P450
MNAPIVSPGFLYHRYKWRKYWRKIVTDQSVGGLVGGLLKGGRLPRELFAHELSNIYWGGGFSTNAVLLNTLFSIFHNQEVLPQLKVAFSRPYETYRELDKCIVLDQVLRESLRLNPPVPLYGRSVRSEETKLLDLKLKRKTITLFSCRPLHHNPNNWSDPLSFKPERWDKKTCEENGFCSQKFAPFGMGPRACIGKEMAIYLLKVCLYGILRDRKPQFESNEIGYSFIFGTQVPKKVTGGIL